MGQYYNPSILKKNWKTAKNAVKVSLKCYDFDNGAKLMEHSYVGNDFVMAMCYLLSLDEYFGLPFVWSGDYADNVITKVGEHNIYDEASDFMYGNDTHSEKSSDYAELLTKIPPYEELKRMGFDGGYIVNLTKKVYVEVPKKPSPNEYAVHPLPLLTADGNSLGGGDYRAVCDNYDYSNDERIGSWKFDRIGFVGEITEYLKKGFKAIDGHFPLDF